MKVEFSNKITKENWLAFNKVYIKWRYRKQLLYRKLLILIGAIVEGLMLINTYNYLIINKAFYSWRWFLQLVNYNPVITIVPPVYLLLLIFLVQKLLFSDQRRVKKYFEHPDNNGVFTEKRIQIDSQGLCVQSEIGSSMISWAGITKILKKDEYVGICTTSNSLFLLVTSTLSQEKRNSINTLVSKEYTGSIIYLKQAFVVQEWVIF